MIWEMVGQLRLKPAEMLAPLSQARGTQETHFSSTTAYIYSGSGWFYKILLLYIVVKLYIGTPEVTISRLVAGLFTILDFLKDVGC